MPKWGQEEYKGDEKVCKAYIPYTIRSMPGFKPTGKATLGLHTSLHWTHEGDGEGYIVWISFRMSEHSFVDAEWERSGLMKHPSL